MPKTKTEKQNLIDNITTELQKMRLDLAQKRIDLKMNKLKNIHEIKKIKREIAQKLTLLNNKEIQDAS